MSTTPCKVCGKPAVTGRTLCEFHKTSIFKLPLAKVDAENKRAQAVGLTADLSYQQWIDALDFFVMTETPRGSFEWACAYCACTARDLGIEHAIPLSLGGGTTVTNCLPACFVCNVMKQALTTEEFLGFLEEVYQSPIAERSSQRIKRYFEALRSGMDMNEAIRKEREWVDNLSIPSP
jgi:hypothetical protein